MKDKAGCDEFDLRKRAGKENVAGSFTERN